MPGPASKQYEPGIASMARYEPEIMSGYLTKRAIKSGRNWRKRYFELDVKQSRLRYWSSKAVGFSGAFLTQCAPPSLHLFFAGISQTRFAPQGNDPDNIDVYSLPTHPDQRSRG